MIQLILHLIGDYVTQSDWMANNKTKKTWPALCHSVIYSLPFLFLKPSVLAFSIILGTHFLIDRFRLARFVVWAKNAFLCPRKELARAAHESAAGVEFCGPLPDLTPYDKYRWSNCFGTGYPSETPAWLAVWLLIAADNTLHLAINYFSLACL